MFGRIFVLIVYLILNEMLTKIIAGAFSLTCASAQSSSINADGSLTVDSTVGAGLACHLFTDDFTLFELEDIDNGLASDVNAYNTTSNISWRYCSYLESTEAFATLNGVDITGSSYIPDEVVSVYNNDNTEIIGFTSTRVSETECPADETLTYTFKSTLLCNEVEEGFGRHTMVEVIAPVVIALAGDMVPSDPAYVLSSTVS